MKRQRKIYAFQLVIHTCLLVSTALTAITAFFISHRPDGINYSSQPFLLALFNVALLVLICIAVSVLVNNFLLGLSSGSSKIDELTGFMTRHAFSNAFEQVVLDTKRSLEPLSILLIDIDHFKLVNDKHGHRIGDELLAMLSKSVQFELRASGVICRWGGDQILVALRDCTEKKACRLAEKILERLRQQTYDNKGKTVSITASIGVAQMVDGDDTEALITRAETGLCSARDNGRDTCVIGYEWILIDYCLKGL